MQTEHAKRIAWFLRLQQLVRHPSKFLAPQQFLLRRRKVIEDRPHDARSRTVRGVVIPAFSSRHSIPLVPVIPKPLSAPVIGKSVRAGYVTVAKGVPTAAKSRAASDIARSPYVDHDIRDIISRPAASELLNRIDIHTSSQPQAPARR